MATYRDAALAAYSSRKTAWIAKAQEKVRPLLIDATGKVLLDPIKDTAAVHTDQDAGLVILQTKDGSNVSFAVWPDQPTTAVRVVQLVDGVWTYGPEARDLDDVGAALLELGARP